MKKEETVKLISAEGFEFVIDKKAAMVSQTLRNMLTSPGSLRLINIRIRVSYFQLGLMERVLVLNIVDCPFGTRIAEPKVRLINSGSAFAEIKLAFLDQGSENSNLAPTRNQTAMEETLRALMEDHKKWMQEQIDAQNLRFNEQQKQMLEQQQQHQLLMGQIMEQLQNATQFYFCASGWPHEYEGSKLYYWVDISFSCFAWIPGSFAETQHGEVRFPEISTTILEKICQYFYWSLQYARKFDCATQMPGSSDLYWLSFTFQLQNSSLLWDG
ncbi:hypothetical protein Cgig2_004974 [Carnegiea gigantea]|uniref:Uncharacterized protein n=1 Tax=Carnegiea gigantea TaxID=171969 RepID=A0A9Q1QRH2_9CARY|nr:hypothetical protein Cgig2_004974 [Carnegiea gigantea]